MAERKLSQIKAQEDLAIITNDTNEKFKDKTRKLQGCQSHCFEVRSSFLTWFEEISSEVTKASLPDLWFW